MLGTVTRAGSLLDLFTSGDPEWGATAVAAQLGIAKSQAHELLVSMVAIGLLRRSGRGRYRLGWRTVALARDALHGEFPDTVLQLLVRLATRFSEPVQLVALDREHLAVIARRQGTRGTDAQIPAYSNESVLHCSAVGKCLLAHADEEQISLLVGARDLPSHTDRTIVDQSLLMQELRSIRQKRVSVDRGEVVSHLRAVAVPLRDESGDTVAALGVWTDSANWDRVGTALTRAVCGTGRLMEGAILAAADAAEAESDGALARRVPPAIASDRMAADRLLDRSAA
jgi:IclR family transcriptional regulator, KDG regulon repressor